MELTTEYELFIQKLKLFMMSKIQNLNGTHNVINITPPPRLVVYDVKDTKFEWNSQLYVLRTLHTSVVYDVKDTKFEWNSQLTAYTLSAQCSCL